MALRFPALTQLQWSPVLETGNTSIHMLRHNKFNELQWSPVLETGNTSSGGRTVALAKGCNGARS